MLASASYDNSIALYDENAAPSQQLLHLIQTGNGDDVHPTEGAKKTGVSQVCETVYPF
jgi:hypothetical protein